MRKIEAALWEHCTAIYPPSSCGCAHTFVASRLAEEQKGKKKNKTPAHEAPLAQFENENENRLDVLQSIGPAYYISL